MSGHRAARAAVSCSAPDPASLAVVLATSQAQRPIRSRSWPVRFTDIAERAGLREPTVYGGVDRKRFIIETNGAGVALVDYDHDGWLDALVLSGTRLTEGSRHEATYPAGSAPTNRLYRNRRDGTFEDVTDASGLRRTGWASSVCAGDYDNDGRIDLFLTYYGQNVLYRNRGGGRFEDVHGPRGARRRQATRWGSGCTFVDYDRDGRLDLFVANYLRFDLATAPEPGAGPNCLWKGISVNCGPKGLPTDTNLLYRNLGNGTFADVSEASGIAARHRPLFDDRRRGRSRRRRLARHLRRRRFDRRDPVPQQPQRHVHRRRAWRAARRTTRTATRRQAWASRSATTTATACSTSSRRTSRTTFPALYRNLGKGLFEDVAICRGPGGREPVRRVGRRHARSGQRRLAGSRLRHGQRLSRRSSARFRSTRTAGRASSSATPGRARFEHVTAQSGAAADVPHSSRGAAFGDVDNDGDIDVLVMNMNEPPSLLRNDYARRQRLAHGRAGGHAVEPVGHRRDGRGDGRRPRAGPRGAEPVELLLARRLCGCTSVSGVSDESRARRGALAERPHARRSTDVPARQVLTIREASDR